MMKNCLPCYINKVWRQLHQYHWPWANWLNWSAYIELQTAYPQLKTTHCRCCGGSDFSLWLAGAGDWSSVAWSQRFQAADPGTAGEVFRSSDISFWDQACYCLGVVPNDWSDQHSSGDTPGDEPGFGRTGSGAGSCFGGWTSCEVDDLSADLPGERGFQILFNCGGECGKVTRKWHD